MPYIPEALRHFFDTETYVPNDGGELAYALSRTVDAYIARHGLSYRTAAEVRDALFVTSDEFNRIAQTYEDVKRTINGDAFQATRRALTQVYERDADITD